MLQKTFQYRLPYQVPRLAILRGAANTTSHHAQGNVLRGV